MMGQAEGGKASSSQSVLSSIHKSELPGSKFQQEQWGHHGLAKEVSEMEATGLSENILCEV